MPVARTTTVGTGQPLVLIPGLFGAAYTYRMLTGPLAALGYQTIVVEPLGYGWSSHPKDADYSYGAQTARVSSALDSLGIRRALFVAQSSGAAIAFRLAVRRPEPENALQEEAIRAARERLERRGREAPRGSCPGALRRASRYRAR